MLEYIKRIIKQHKCQHDMEVSKWHWTHGPTGSEPKYIEVEYICTRCGKLAYIELIGKDASEWENAMQDYKRW